MTKIDDAETGLVRRVKTHLGEKFGPFQSFEQVPSPHEHRAFYPVAFVTLGDGREVVAKWSTKPEKLLREYHVQQLCIENHIPTAQIVSFDETIPVLVMERLQGHELTQAELDAATVAEIGGLLRRIHDLPLQGLHVSIPVKPGKTFVEMVGLRIDECLAVLAAKEFDVDGSAIQGTYRALAASNAWSGPQALIRRDMHAGNWFRMDDGTLSAIDHGNAAIGYVPYDLAHILAQLKDDSALVDAFRRGYGTEAFDAATAPATRALADLVYGVEILSWVVGRGVPQPRFEAEGRALIASAQRVADTF